MYDAASEHLAGDIALQAPPSRSPTGAPEKADTQPSVDETGGPDTAFLIGIWWVRILLDILGGVTLFATVALATSVADASIVTAAVAALVLLSRAVRWRRSGAVALAAAGVYDWGSRTVSADVAPSGTARSEAA